MKKLLGMMALLVAISLPVFAQGRRLSDDDQRRFDSYYSRWQEYRRTNNRDEIQSMEKRLQDVYQHYGIPSSTPYTRIASGGQGDYRWDRDNDRDWDRDHNGDRWHRDRDRDWDRDRDRDRDWGRDNDRRGRWNNRLSADDQRRFDSYYSRWLEYRRTNNRDEIVSMEKRMQDVYQHNGIPNNVPYGAVASNGRRY
jgi:hypothetical protein